MDQNARALVYFCAIPIVLGTLAGTLPAATKQSVSMTKLHVNAFTVVGIEVRTSNAHERSGGSIPQQWKRLTEEHLLDKIQNRADSDVIAVYTDYESDKDGAYNYVLGAKVRSSNGIPAGTISVSVKSGDYAVFTAEDEPPPVSVPRLWQHIWSLEKVPNGLRRAYQTDFEVYSRAREPVKIYIGLEK